MVSSARERTPLTAADYLAIERQAQYKSEFYNGEMFAMSGASRRHNLIVLNIGGELRAQLRQSPCEVYVSDMRVKISHTGAYTYPDVVVACAEPRFEDAVVDTLLNPTVLIEVLSPSTADYDRGGKFERYRTLPSLQAYLLVAQERCHVVHYRRQSDHTWLLAETNDPQDSITIPAIGCTLLLSEIYARVQFES